MAATGASGTTTVRYGAMREMEPLPTLFFEFHGAEEGVAEGLRQVEELSAGHGGGRMRRATRPEDRSSLWEARHQAYFAALALAPGKKGLSRAQAMGGTCTGEHGVGLGKRRYLEAEHGAGVALMRRLKRALDPDDILDPGKLLPD